MTAWATPYIGLPWAPLGRDRAGVDCFGLYRLALGELTGFWLPSYAERYATTEETAEIERVIHAEADRDWLRVDSVRPLDVAVFRRGRFDSHIGIVLSPSLFIHMIDRDCSKVGRFDDPLYRRILAGCWRHRDMPEFWP